MLSTILPILLFAALGLAVLGAARRAGLWRQGRAAKVDLLGGLLAMPRRYMVDLHHVVARDKYIANTHVATAGGFVLAALLAVLVHGFGLHNRVLGFALLAASGLMFVGACFMFARRLNPPARLSKGPWMRLPKSLLMFSASFFVATLPVAGILPENFGGWILAVLLGIGVLWGVCELFLGMTWGGPMKHAFAGALHLAWHRRAERFGGGRSTGLKPLDLNDSSAPLGVEKPRDFTWNQLLGFDACVQCGKCEAACPAFAAGQADHHVLDGGGRPLGEHGGAPHQPIVNGLVDADTLWSCTTCRACVEECPMMIEHVDAIVDMRRYLTLEKGATPNKGAEVLDNLIATDNPGGFNPGGRMNWAADLNLPVMAEVREAEVLFWVGDGAFDMRNQRTLRSFVKVLRAAKVDFAVLGLEERDSGDVARRLGDEATFQMLARRTIQTLGKYSFKRIVTCDPHSFHVLKNEYGAFGGHYEVQHHSGFMADLLRGGRLNLAAHKGASVTYHDPCYLGRYNGEYQAPRDVLKALGIEVREMQRSGFRARCCGGGGGAPITDIPGRQRIPDMRMDDIRETQAEIVAVGCPQCTAMLEGVVEPRPLIKDLAELVAEALIEPLAPGQPSPARREPAEVE
jgi:Fe-S oxidoreductase